MVLDLQQKTYFLITGASRGIGRTMAVEVASKLKPGSVIVLVARSQDGLGETKATIEANAAVAGKTLQVLTYSVDLAKATAEQFQELLSDSLKVSGEQVTNFERSFIIHNAGSVGDVSKLATDVSDTKVWMDYYHMNVFSTISLNCEFFRVFAQIPKLAVNLSSKCAIVPFVSMSFYCSGKAARDMYFSVLAAEQKEEENTIVLNYAPGAIDTDMTVLVQQETANKQLAKEFKHMRDTKIMLTTDQTTKKFLQVLEEQKFKSGDHVDYYD